MVNIMNEEIELLLLVAQRLKKAKIEYMLVGSMAMTLYATPRMTRDVDIVIAVGLSDVEKLKMVFQDDFYFNENSIKSEIEREGFFNIIHKKLVVKIDFIVRKNEQYRRVEFDRRREIRIGKSYVFVATIEDVILSKLIWIKGRDSVLHREDIENLLKSSNKIDFAYLKKWAKMLNLTGEFEGITNE